MKISANDWKKYIRKLSAINSAAASKMERWMAANGPGDINAMITYAHSLATRYGEAAASLACEMYDAVAAAQSAAVPPAEPAATATYPETAKAVKGTLNNQRNSVPDTVGRLVKQAGADTTLKNAARDGAQFAWIPNGDTCAFCMMLASNGWQYMSKSALKYGHAEHIHPHCDCEYAIRFGSSGGVEGYNPDEYLEAYNNAEGATWLDKVNSMRRDQYAADPEKYRAQKRAAYAARQEANTAAVEALTSTGGQGSGLSGGGGGGIIKPDRIVSGHDGTPKEASPGEVIDHVWEDGDTETRSFYGENGLKMKDITNHNHGNPKEHPYGRSGEHAHDYEWNDDGSLKTRNTREITDAERKENGDIL